MVDRPIGRIDLRIREIGQLFNSLDATPFPETDLDADAEEFILSWAMEYHSDAELQIRIQVERLPADSQFVRQVELALHSYFEYRAAAVQRRLHRLLARGRLNLIIGLSCLGASVFGANLIRHLGASALLDILRESLIIGGWVAMWGPLEILLYDWWPLRQERRVCERLSVAIIEIIAACPAPPVSPTKP